MDMVKKSLTIKVSALRKWAVKYAARLKNWNHIEIASGNSSYSQCTHCTFKKESYVQEKSVNAL
jgi:hypothetical protein